LLRILYSDGTEDKCNGKVKHYEGDQPALCHFDLDIEGREQHDLSNLKLVYDEETRESVYFNYLSYGFYKSWVKYMELYIKSKRDLELTKKFKEFLEPFVNHYGSLNENDIIELLVCYEQGIREIYA